MAFASLQQTDSTNRKTNLTFKVYENKIYYLWNEEDINGIVQIWFAESEQNGSDFNMLQLTNDTFDANEPQLHIYDNKIYVAFYAVEQETSVSQVWTASMDLDCGAFAVLHTTEYATGARKPKIVVKNNVIYLAYEMNRYDGVHYHHMVRAKLNIDGTEFYEAAASTSLNEVVDDVKLFMSGDPSDNKVYYMWTREYFITDPPALYLYSSEGDLSTFTQILVLSTAKARNLYVNNDKVYFTYLSTSGNGNMCSVINSDTTGLTDLLSNDPNAHSSLFVDTDTNGHDIIDFIVSNNTDASFPTRTYEILAATLNANTLEYVETPLLSGLTTSFNDDINLQFSESNDIQHCSWLQYDVNGDYQIYTGIFAEELLCVGITCPDFCDFDTHTRYYNGSCDPATGECVYDIEENAVVCGYDPSNETSGMSFPWWTLGFLFFLERNGDK